MALNSQGDLSSPCVKMAIVLHVLILRKLRTFRSLGNDERSFVLGAIVLPVFVSAGIRIFGARKVQGWLRRWASNPSKKQSVSFVPWPEIRMVRRGQRALRSLGGTGGSCLPRSLTLWALLLRRGLGTDLRVGFRKCGGKVEGHAWVEYKGIPLNEDQDIIRTYSAFDHEFSFDVRMPDK